MTTAKRQKLFATYIKEPFFLMMRNKSIFILLLLFIVINHFSEKFTSVELVYNADFLFGSFPDLFLSLIRQPFVIALWIGFFLVKAVVIAMMGMDFYRIFARERKGLGESITHIPRKAFLWLLFVEGIVYVVFTAIAFIFFLFSYLVWMNGHSVASIILLFGAFCFFYPLFYLAFSVSSMLAVLPLSPKEKFARLASFFRPPIVLKAYVFYGIRLSIEYVFLFGVPAIAFLVFENSLIATISAMIGLLVPLILFRGAAYEFKLAMLRHDPKIRAIFANHFALHPQES